MEVYTRKTDPNDHISMYLLQLETQNLEGIFLCRAFHDTLRDAPYRYFMDPPPNSITNFLDFASKFITQHITTSVFGNLPTSWMQ